MDLILTESEREAWKKLATDEEHEKFIEDFWHSRDPDPDTEENEFKEESTAIRGQWRSANCALEYLRAT